MIGIFRSKKKFFFNIQIHVMRIDVLKKFNDYCHHLITEDVPEDVQFHSKYTFFFLLSRS